MTMFGLHESQLISLVSAVVGLEAARRLTRPEAEERFARATWTGIAEPGDRLAGLLTSSLGAPDALTALIERWSAERIGAALRDAGAPAVTDGELQDALDRWQPRLTSGSATLALTQAARHGARLLVPGDELWPTGLADLQEHGPLALWVRGTDRALASLATSIALVGARAATGYGEHVTMEAAAGLVDRGYAIVSGAAYGIDGMAHRSALASSGQTVAILAGGVDRFYPAGHDALLTRIAEAGAVVSEVPCGIAPTKWRFLQRNRLIAAVSLATIVLEAGWRSGSLNTAGHASALGRPLGAVPGPVTSAASAGCHRLIRDYDAVCVTSADEMAELAPLAPSADPEGRDGAAGSRTAVSGGAAAVPPEFTRVIDALSTRSPRAVADIAVRSGLSVTDVRAALGSLELEGVATERESGWVKAAARG